MKIAFCFSGQLRTAEYTVNSILKYIGDLLPHVDFFIHTWDKNVYRSRGYNSPKMKEYLTLHNIDSAKQLDKSILCPYTAPPTYDVLKKITPVYKFQSIQVENEEVVQKQFGSIYGFLMPHLYGWYKVNNLKKIHENTYNFKYDYVVRTRPDMIFSDEHRLRNEIEQQKKHPGSFIAHSDLIYIGSSEIMDIASSFQIKNSVRIPISEFMTLHNITTIRSTMRHTSIYRPDAMPIDPLDYKRCYNIDKDWYSNMNDTFRFKIE